MKKTAIVAFWLLTVFSLSAQWAEFNMEPGKSLWTSSVLKETIKGKERTYGPEALFDQNSSAPWVEGVVGSGIGESITVLLQKAVTDLNITNGFAASERLFHLNNRVKTLKMSLLIGLTAPGLVSEMDYTLYFVKEFPLNQVLQLDDTMADQHFDFTMDTAEQRKLYFSVIRDFRKYKPDLFKMILDDLGIKENKELTDEDLSLIAEIYGFYSLKLTIADAYKGDRYDDTCISELKLGLISF